jgi:membrane protein YqaA with SNARE-associated domain
MNWEAYITVFLTASTKFLAAAFVGINGFGLSFAETFCIVCTGGIFGTLVFYFLGNKLIGISQKKRLKKIQKLLKEGKSLPRVMTKTNKLIVKTKHVFGIWGLAFLTASILSIPIGSIICAKFYRHKKSTIFIIIIFILINSMLLSLLANSIPSIGK